MTASNSQIEHYIHVFKPSTLKFTIMKQSQIEDSLKSAREERCPVRQSPRWPSYNYCSACWHARGDNRVGGEALLSLPSQRGRPSFPARLFGLAASVCMYVALEALEAQLRLRGHSAALQYIVKAARARRLLPLLSLQLSVIRPQRIGLAHSPRRPMRTEALKKQKTYCCNYCHGEAKRSKTTYYIYFTSATPVTTPRTAYLLRLLRVSI